MHHLLRVLPTGRARGVSRRKTVIVVPDECVWRRMAATQLRVVGSKGKANTVLLFQSPSAEADQRPVLVFLPGWFVGFFLG